MNTIFKLLLAYFVLRFLFSSKEPNIDDLCEEIQKRLLAWKQ